MVVSGINHGANMGDDTIYSGTVAAATEGFLLGVPAIAISLVARAPSISAAARVARELVERYQRDPGASRPSSTSTCPTCPSTRSRAFA